MRHLLIAGLAIGVAGCSSSKATSPVQAVAAMPKSAATAMVIVYRTKTDHRAQVPVILSDDRRTIISYPHPKDLGTTSDGPPLPTDLGEGWLLDNRGIGTGVAFLGMDRADYAALDHAPTLAQLDSLIVDRDPLRELWECGPRSGYTDLIGELSALARTNGFASRCKQLK